MKKAFWVLAVAFILVVIVHGFSTYDYQWQCTRCLRDYRIVEKRFYGITYSRTQTLVSPGHDLTEITGASCQHIYRKGGFGEDRNYVISILMSDGMTAEGGNVSPALECNLRKHLIYMGEFQIKALDSRETLNLIDTCFPADATVDEPKSPRLLNSGSVMLLIFSEKEGGKAGLLHWPNSNQDRRRRQK